MAKLLLFIVAINRAESEDYYSYASHFQLTRTLPSTGLNLDNPIDAARALLKHDKTVNANVLGAYNGVLNIMLEYNLTLNELLNLQESPARSSSREFSKQEEHIFHIINDLKSHDQNTKGPSHLCRKSSLPKHSKLKCKIITESLSCFKIELVHLVAPKIFLVHDYYSQLEKKAWLEELSRTSSIFHMKSLYDDHDTTDDPIEEFKSLLSFNREGKIGYLTEGSTLVRKSEEQLKHLLDHVFYQKISKKVFEPYQFGTYGIGGYIDSHIDTYGTPDETIEDTLDFSETSNGDRLITTLSYLKGSSSQGGSTIFPYLDISIPPTEGSLLIWENLDTNTFRPLKTSTHRSCPVIYGAKLVLNKWVCAY